MAESRQTELRWVFRPTATRPAPARALAGRTVHGTGQVGPDGQTDVVLADGTYLRGLLLHAMLDPAVDLVGAIEALGALLQRARPPGGGLGRDRVTSGSRGRR